MTKGVEENEFLDVGSEQETFLYGTTFTSVRDVMSENKLCVIDCRPEVCNSNVIHMYFFSVLCHTSAVLRSRAKGQLISKANSLVLI